MKQHGHTVLVERQAGKASGFEDGDYAGMGAEIVDSPEKICKRSEMMLRVKGPQPFEYRFLGPDQIYFSYLHLASSEELTRTLMRIGSVNIAYETVQKANGALPLLTPMSEVAGAMAIQEGAKVYVLDVNLDRLRYLSNVLPPSCFVVMSSPAAIRDLVTRADIVVGAVLVPGSKCPLLITPEMLKTMKKGAVLVDVAIDQGGCFETSMETSHDNPTYIVENIVHYAVSNMPGALPRTSTVALTNATLPYALEIANKGWKRAMQENPELKRGANVVRGKVTYEGVADAFGIQYELVDSLL